MMELGTVRGLSVVAVSNGWVVNVEEAQEHMYHKDSPQLLNQEEMLELLQRRSSGPKQFAFTALGDLNKFLGGIVWEG